MKKLVYILLIIIVGAAKQSVAQNLDSLWKVYNTTTQPDTNRLKAIHKIANIYRDNNPDTCIVLAKQELKLAETTKQKKYQASALNIIGIAFMDKGNYPEALKNYFAALKIRLEIKAEYPEEIGNKKGIANSYNNIGIIYEKQGNYPEALKNHFAALKIREEVKDKQGIANSYGNMGLIYDNQGNYPEALKKYFACLKIEEEIKDKFGIAISCNNIGIVYEKQGNLPEALKMHLNALKIEEEIKDDQGVSFSYNNIGIICKKQGNYAEALKNYFASLKIREKIGDKFGVASCFLNLGELYTKTNKRKEAQDYLSKALQLSLEIGNKDVIKYSYAALAVLDSTLGNYQATFEHHKLFVIYRDSLNNEETKKKSLQAGMQYEYDKKEIATKAEQDKRDAINAEEKKKQQLLLILVTCILILVAVFAVFMFNRFKITQRQKVIIETQKHKVDEAYEQLHEKNKEVMDSIRYAKRIQTALITSEKYITNSLNKLKKE